ncbi:MAG TPA: hypothetical protein VNO86_02365 [Candidatus Binatia bacterium]|nr:hypothetical protein [Candidatus Binatia bacterium]
MRDRRGTPVSPLRFLIATVALVVAACGGGGASPTATPPPSEGAPSSAPPSTAPASPTTGASTEPLPSLPAGGAEDLVALLPAEVNGVTFQRGGYDFGSLPGFVPLDVEEDEFDAFLKEHGKSLRDVRIAIATATGSTGQGAGTMVMAFQVNGIEPTAWESWAVDALASGAGKKTVAGKQVYGDEIPGMAVWLYVKGDTAFWVFGTDGKLVEGILAALP